MSIITYFWWLHVGYRLGKGDTSMSCDGSFTNFGGGDQVKAVLYTNYFFSCLQGEKCDGWSAVQRSDTAAFGFWHLEDYFTLTRGLLQLLSQTVSWWICGTDLSHLFRIHLTSDGFNSVHSICFYLSVILSVSYFAIGWCKLVSVTMVHWHNIVDQFLFVWERSHKVVLLLKYLPGIVLRF